MRKDARGNHGLIESGMNGFYYTPYTNGQGNYCINPLLAEYATRGSGHGRFAAALEHLEGCETEWDMLRNMENSMMRNVILDPGSLGYSDVEQDANVRRASTEEELKARMIEKNEPFIKPAIEYYRNGNAKPLRDHGGVCVGRLIIFVSWSGGDDGTRRARDGRRRLPAGRRRAARART